MSHAALPPADTADLWVFEALAQTYRPRVISVEYNAQFPVGSSIAFPDPSWMPLSTDEASTWAVGCYTGSSAGAIYAAAARHHYKV